MPSHLLDPRRRRRRPIDGRYLVFGLALSLLACPKSEESGRSAAPDGSEEAKEDLAREPFENYVEKGDLAALQKRGRLRILTPPAVAEGLRRSQSALFRERRLARELAERLGLEPKILEAASLAQMIKDLEAGKGDIIAGHLTETASRAARVAFTRPLVAVDEVVVGREGEENLPESVAALGGREIHVPTGSAFIETLSALRKGEDPVQVDIREHAEGDSEHLLYAVAQGDVPLTIADEDVLRSAQAYMERLEPLFVVKEDRPIAWAFRKSNPELLRRANAFIIENSMTHHFDDRFSGDLDGIKERGVLRVITRNNGINYFLWRGIECGFEYELAKMIANELGVRLEMVVPPGRDQLIPWLLEGRGDVIAAMLTITKDRAERVAFSRPYIRGHELIVQRKGGPQVSKLADLKGKTVHVRKSSSYRRTLDELQKSHGPFEVVYVAEDLETPEIIRAVAKGEYDLTLSDSHIFEVEAAYDSRLVAGAAITETDAEELAYAVRPTSKQLLEFLDGFVKREYRGLRYNMYRDRYFENRSRIRRVRTDRVAKSGKISPYDSLIRKYAARYEFDWRLMAAQAYVESGFDPNVKSWVGAKGLFQVMPKTGASMGFHRLEQPAEGIHAGIRYMSKMMKRFDPKIPIRQRLRFALAAYNAGLGHVYDAQRLAAEKGWDPKVWFGNVEKAMLLLGKREYARRAKHGYVRGEQPVAYVSHIQSLYDAYVKVAEP